MEHHYLLNFTIPVVHLILLGAKVALQVSSNVNRGEPLPRRADNSVVFAITQCALLDDSAKPILGPFAMPRTTESDPHHVQEFDVRLAPRPIEKHLARLKVGGII